QSDEAFAKFGLSTSHVLILSLVDKNPGIQPGKLAENLYLKPSTITRLVQKLERRQLVQRNSEGRSTSIVCTDDGNKVTGEIIEKWNGLMVEKRQQLGDRYIEVLSEMIANALHTISDE
ncbi:MAG TPA: MarR family transcriptional regulator, partial [Balneolaceae bacterium]|nr:MarR family transcriptional regulator [Balneolaceae bacterium]